MLYIACCALPRGACNSQQAGRTLHNTCVTVNTGGATSILVGRKIFVLQQPHWMLLSAPLSLMMAQQQSRRGGGAKCARQGIEGAMFALCQCFDVVKASWPQLNVEEELKLNTIPPCEYRSDTDINVGINIIDI